MNLRRDPLYNKLAGILDVDPALPVEQLYTELESKVRALRPDRRPHSSP